ncbi:nicotinate-nucleotide adenylyltransferase [Paucibacter sp. TC2R-5]|uniref:nicotinate-nucleotide adenylyltransferase n=1 Tax=Paucibacter sp. TC2R-5 TaxID=2893555 RepID=UPI0021E383B8|nr:nicotinate-nucleotide adenylyltransferase [Paucibacter sp. TC2R-5]MCV2359174.1 nicotinate-nucleotide adenylyltransferase [Paucibacter sp. TC2R-5]
MAVKLGGTGRTGLFGGSFDPPHLGHLSLAHCALTQLSLDQLLWMPAGRPWQKTGRGLAAPLHRRAMAELMVAGEPRFLVDDSELERDGASYTIDTVRARQTAHPAEQLFLVIGQDQFERFHTWRDWRALISLVTLAVAARAGQEVQGSAEVMEVVHAEPNKMLKLAMPAMQVSSTQVRELASRNEELSPLVGDAVAGYIALHRLYSE